MSNIVVEKNNDIFRIICLGIDVSVPVTRGIVSN